MGDIPGEHEDRVTRAERLAREALARRSERNHAHSEEPGDGLHDTPARASEGLPREAELGETPREPPDAVDMNRVFDRAESKYSGALDRYDPEAGKMGLGTRIRRAVRARAASPFGRFVVAIVLAMAGAALAIVAAVFPEWPLIVSAGIFFPASLAYLYVRYQQWLGHKRYIYRLLETLGEDVSDFDLERRYRAPRTRRRTGR
jgi:hypothetical protein